MSFLENFKNELFETLGEYKKLILIFYLVFLFLLVGSIVLAPNIVGNMQDMSQVNNTNGGDNAQTDTNDEGALYLFIHNEMGSLFVYISSIFFGISAIVMPIYDALNIGLVSALFVKIGKGSLFYAFYLIPHGIFEFTGIILSSVAGLILFKFIWKFIKTMFKNEGDLKNRVSSSFNDNKKILKQSFILIIFTTILLLIAAPIEAYVSIPFAEFITSIFP